MSRPAVVALAAAAAVTAACRVEAPGDPIPASVPGSYVWAENGSILNKVTWEIDARLDLRPDGTYTLKLDKVMNGERDSTETTTGTYSVSEGELVIKGPTEARGNRADTHTLLIRPDSLVGRIGWAAHLFLRGIGASDPVFVRRGQG
jgi:hypothetical protein